MAKRTTDKYLRWTPEDNVKLAQIYLEGGMKAAIQAFPKRTPAAVETKVGELRKLGDLPKLEPRPCHIQRDINLATRRAIAEEQDLGLPVVRIVPAASVRIDIPAIRSVFDLAINSLTINVQDRDATDLRRPRYRHERYD